MVRRSHRSWTLSDSLRRQRVSLNGRRRARLSGLRIGGNTERAPLSRASDGRGRAGKDVWFPLGPGEHLRGLRGRRLWRHEHDTHIGNLCASLLPWRDRTRDAKTRLVESQR
jgi:hypothetical protein